MRVSRRGWVTIAIVVACASAAILLILLYVPIAQEPSGTEAIGARLYQYETEDLFGSSGYEYYTFGGVQFEFHLWCAITPGGGSICGNATEPGGATYPYSFFDGPPSSDPPWQTWVAPDGHEAVQYREGGTARLLVAL